MWIFALFYILAISICQAAGKENSTQMLYFSLVTDDSIIKHINATLRPFAKDDLNVDKIQITTICQNDKLGHKTCNCTSGYRWADDVCRIEKACCGEMCTFPQTSTEMCISETSVSITGNIILDAEKYKTCMSGLETDCAKNLTKEMKKVYSTLEGFDFLKIKSFSLGSINALFEMTIVYGIEPDELTSRSEELATALEGKLSMETKGVVTITVPTEPVKYRASVKVTCESQKDLGDQLKWQLKRNLENFLITTGTVATLSKTDTKSEVSLRPVDELWAGEYSCVYTQTSNQITIIHKANAMMDVCLEPEIHAMTVPQFPLCAPSDQSVVVTIKCKIQKSHEKYNVTWSNVLTTLDDSEDKTEYSAKTFVSCKNESNPSVTCTFANRCGQTVEKSVPINIIKVGEKYCKREDEWEDTKADFEAVLKCENSDGERKRQCKSDGEWGDVAELCVSLQLKEVLGFAHNSDTGRGELDKNAAGVFSGFKNATQTNFINSFRNMKTSVEILSTMKTKLKTLNSDSVDNFLDSSNNLLNKSISDSWKEDHLTNYSIAESYLTSVEKLMHMANMTYNSTKENLEVKICKEDKCTNSVFNVSVRIQSPGVGMVKTAGYQNLVDHLPNNKSAQPNSIVVSTTVEDKTILKNMKVDIKFSLINPRPRNVRMICVYWDNASHAWSEDGCDWKGSSDEGHCVCDHLSSFTILMSKYPVKVDGLIQMTYVGLAISIMSLLISLLIELIVWNDVTKTSTLYLRHTAHVNISLCLLIADICFLASSEPKRLSDTWCKASAVAKHFFYLAMFFWMLCLSTTLLHQAVFLFHKLSKKIYLRYSLVLGYACPLLIVFITFLANGSGAEGSYYSKDACWLVYSGDLKGSIFTFIIPVGVIVFVNTFSMLVVIMKLLDHHQNTEGSQEKEKMAAKMVVRSVVLLTPIFGLTWMLGFAVLLIDLTEGIHAHVINYTFNLLNSFQGLLILLTTCLGDKMTREALLKHFRKKKATSVSSISNSTTTTKSDSPLK